VRHDAPEHRKKLGQELRVGFAVAILSRRQERTPMLLAVTPRFGVGSITHAACGVVIFFNYQNFPCACHNQT
jgi:hypothetical protein